MKMCMALYIGSDNALPLIEWREGETPICISALDPSSQEDDFASGYLVKPYKYHVGSWLGCSCGFSFDFTDEQFDEKENILSKQSVEKLFEFIRSNVKGGECELLSFWESGQYDGIPHQASIDLRKFALGDAFEFLEGQYTVVRWKGA